MVEKVQKRYKFLKQSVFSKQSVQLKENLTNMYQNGTYLKMKLICTDQYENRIRKSE